MVSFQSPDLASYTLNKHTANKVQVQPQAPDCGDFLSLTSDKRTANLCEYLDLVRPQATHIGYCIYLIFISASTGIQQISVNFWH